MNVSIIAASMLLLATLYSASVYSKRRETTMLSRCQPAEEEGRLRDGESWERAGTLAEHREEPQRHEKAVDAHFGWPHAAGVPWTTAAVGARTRQRARRTPKDLKRGTKGRALGAQFCPHCNFGDFSLNPDSRAPCTVPLPAAGAAAAAHTATASSPQPPAS
eukprot:scaffold41220_cov71-Phaeocystis_antarctica.AAC.8